MTLRPASIDSIRLGSSARIVAATLTGLLALSACGDDGGSSGDDIGATSMADGTSSGGDETPAGTPTYAEVQAVWDAHCVAGCHEPGGTWSLFDLTAGGSYDILVNGDPAQSELPYVMANDTSMSYVWHKLNGTQGTVGGGVAMPAAREGMEVTVLTAEELSTVEDWINGGAPM